MVIAVKTGEHEIAWNRYRRIVNLKWTARKCFLEIGAELCEFKRLEQWIELEYSSFRAFLADPDVDISERNAYRLIRDWKLYVEQLGVQAEKLIAIGPAKLDMMARYVDQNNVDYLLNSAATNSRTAFKALLTGVEPVITPFDWSECLREARSRCLELMQSDAPDEVKSFAADFFSATGGRVSKF